MAKPAINPNELGDLVPKCAHEDHWPSLDMGPKYQEQLKEISHKLAAVRNRWKCDLLPMWHDAVTPIGENVAAFSDAAYVCAVHLSGSNVGVLRMDGCTGNCALFLRLKRVDWFAWADKNKVPRDAGRAFTKRMDRELGKKMLMDARTFKLGPSNVHHPSVLALLCTMSRHDWLHLADEPAMLGLGIPSVDELDTFTLVALPPLPAEFEQCLGLLGHSAAFVKDNAGSDDDEVSLSTRSDAKPIDAMWGAVSAGDKVIGSLAHLFEEGGIQVGRLADPFLFKHGMADFNGKALAHGRLLERMQRASSAAAPSVQPRPSADAMAYLDPSDDEVTVATAPAPAPAPAPKAKTPAPRQQPPKAKARAPPKKKKKGSDSDELSDSDEESKSLSETSEEEEDDTSSSDDSGDSDDDEDSKRSAKRASSSGSGLSGSESPAATPPSKKRARPTADATTPTPPAPPLTIAAANGDQALMGVLVEMAKPCCEKLKQLDEEHGISDHTASYGQLSGDVQLLQTARTPVALLAASLSINSTLAECLRDHYRQPDCCVIDYQSAHRLHQMAVQAKRFVEEMERKLAPPSRSGAQQG